MSITVKRAQDLHAVFFDVNTTVAAIDETLYELEDADLKGEDRDNASEQLTNELDEMIGAVRKFAGELGYEIEA